MKRTGRQNRLRFRRGAEVLEMAMVLPLLLVLAFGTCEFGYWFYLEHNFQAAAREGVRAGIAAQNTDDGERQVAAVAAVDAVMQSIRLPQDKYDVTVDWLTVDGVRYMRVTVKADWRDVGVETGLFVRFRQGAQTDLVHEDAKIAGQATMRVES